eukprot:GHVS01014739.1.p1 GENE.GHVS01014739.1~~GHVS01014739.1.p1  ORF type:complete len:560 (+),score=132.56 GHVS01014739.1:311-1990(+)
MSLFCHPLLIVCSSLLVCLSLLSFNFFLFSNIKYGGPPPPPPPRILQDDSSSASTLGEAIHNLYSSTRLSSSSSSSPSLFPSSSPLFPRFSGLTPGLLPSLNLLPPPPPRPSNLHHPPSSRPSILPPNSRPSILPPNSRPSILPLRDTAGFHAAQAALSSYLSHSPLGLLSTLSRASIDSPTSSASIGLLPEEEEDEEEEEEGHLTNAGRGVPRSGLTSSSTTDGASSSRPTFPPPAAIDLIRSSYPNCPLACETGWTGDLWCDKECNTEECGFDDGDCKDWCRSECPPSWLADGNCDLDCYTEECKWDQGDCKELEEKGYKELPLSSSAEFDYSGCQCDSKLLDNGVCDPECNTYECNRDKLNCSEKCNDSCITLWQADGVCDQECDTPGCSYDKGDCDGCDAANECRAWMPANTVCDVQCNTAECGHDSGDCIGMLDVLGVDYSVQPFVVEFCAEEFVGDGYCDIQCFSEAGQWDGGDCAGADIAALKKTLVFPGHIGMLGPQQSRRMLLSEEEEEETTDAAASRQQKDKLVRYRRKLTEQNGERKYRPSSLKQLQV